MVRSGRSGGISSLLRSSNSACARTSLPIQHSRRGFEQTDKQVIASLRAAVRTKGNRKAGYEGVGDGSAVFQKIVEKAGSSAKESDTFGGRDLHVRLGDPSIRSRIQDKGWVVGCRREGLRLPPPEKLAGTCRPDNKPIIERVVCQARSGSAKGHAWLIRT